MTERAELEQYLREAAYAQPPESADPRIRTVTYHANTAYAVRAQVGYQIDLEFEPGETFVGLGAGDIEGLAFLIPWRASGSVPGEAYRHAGNLNRLQPMPSATRLILSDSP